MSIRTASLTLLAAGLLAPTARAAPVVVNTPVSDTLVWHASAEAPSDSLSFAPIDPVSNRPFLRITRDNPNDGDQWVQPPFGDELLSDLERWRSRGKAWRDDDVIIDYNRVDLLRLGLHVEFGKIDGLTPRVGGRYEYAFGRKRSLYGIQFEQPIVPSGRFATGVSLTRTTDHLVLQQIEDEENTLALLFGRQDYRDYFEREGAGGYVRWRVPDFSNISVHLDQNDWRSLAVNRGARSWFHRDRPLRDNPSIDDGRSRSVTLRLEHLLHRSARRRAGIYHWLEIERAGAALGGDFTYTRGLLDLRSVLRLSPATTLSLRTVAGSGMAGTLPAQKAFTLGGVDGLRGHRFGQYQGDQVALAQAEYTVGLWRIVSELFEGGLHAIVFADAGRAWSNPDHHWDATRQQMRLDGGFGFSTSEDNVRVYLARNLQDPGSGFVTSLRLQRPF